MVSERYVGTAAEIEAPLGLRAGHPGQRAVCRRCDEGTHNPPFSSTDLASPAQAPLPPAPPTSSSRGSMDWKIADFESFLDRSAINSRLGQGV